METHYYLFVFLMLSLNECKCDRGDYIGCYKSMLENLMNTHTGQSVDVCLSACEEVYYKYALIGNESFCFCGNTPGQFQLPLSVCSTPCPKNDTQMCGGEGVFSVYDTHVIAPGPPSSISINNITETSMKVLWTPPEAYSFITSYMVRAQIVHTYSTVKVGELAWSVSNQSFFHHLTNLIPGTTYEIILTAVNDGFESPNKSITAETRIAIPEPTPPDIQIRERRGDRMLVYIPEATNYNGPVSMYRIVVSIEVHQQGFMETNLSNYTYAKEHEIPYYVTAELDPDDIKSEFIIGDRSTYNGFYNAPLPLTNDIEVSLGVVSEKNHVKRIRYAEATKKIIFNINEPEETSPMVVALGAGIAICVVLLLIGVGLLIILRKRIQLARVHRESQSVPLKLSEPCMEIENSGFIQENNESVDYYSNLKRKLWNIPRNLLDVDISCVIGLGSYGKFTKGKIQQHGAQTPGQIQIVADRDLEKSEKKLMLQELDLLIKASEHENVISLIGFCETNTTLFVVLEDSKQPLKELLLQSRHRDLQNNKFCLLPENRILQYIVDIARGMDYLHNKKILHKRLSCRNIAISDNGIAKVSGFGLSHMRPLHETPDYTRWTSHEMLRHTRFNPKADVWSFGILMWETLTIGATPYFHSSNKDVVTRILRGMRPSQPSYVGDELFQICLQCWQVDPDERPAFSALISELTPFAEESNSRSLSFTHYNGFDYEPYVPQYEILS